jgi:uncharacterized protein with ParB-like and HNH nuclease domain
MKAQHMSFATLIAGDFSAHDHYHVPKYQREYTWGKLQWEQLLKDIKENYQGYFMGSIICVFDVNSAAPSMESIYEVIDGQQRLTTLSILLAAIFNKMNQLIKQDLITDDQDKDEAKSLMDSIRQKLVKRKSTIMAGENGCQKIGSHYYFLRVQPSVQNHNFDDYVYLLSELALYPAQQKPANYGNRLFSRAYRFFMDSDNIPHQYNELRELLQKISQMMFVQITVNTQADAFALFESLNNRGVPLAAMDIIKNKILGTLEKKHNMNIDDSFEKWQKIINSIPEPEDQERFLRHFYHAFKHDPAIAVDGAPRAIRSQIIRIYETLINRNALSTFTHFENLAPLYGRLVRADYPGELGKNLRELDYVQSVPAYVILLYLFSQPTHCYDAGFLARVTDLLTRFFIRRNVTDKPPTRQIDQIFIEMVEACSKKIAEGKPLNYAWFESELMRIAHPASQEEFRIALKGQLYSTNSWMTRYLLIQINKFYDSKEYAPDLWMRDDKGRFVWTVEHVLPQADKLPSHWVGMIANGDSIKASKIQDEWVHKLGNLTISGYNSDLATSAFQVKQELSKERNFLGHKIDIGYRNGLALNKFEFLLNHNKFNLATAPIWNEEFIEARTNAMVDILLKINQLPIDV